MLGKIGDYRTALGFAIAIAFTNLVGWSAIAFHNSYFTKQAITVCALSLAIPFGLWVQSNMVRYIGAVWMIVFAGGLIWPLVSSGTAPFINRPGQTIPLLLFYSFVAILNLLTSGILLLSKKFAMEFASEQEHQPKYKKYLKWLVLVAIVAAMLIATLMDILNLASN
jgi:hypothetical protein